MSKPNEVLDTLSFDFSDCCDEGKGIIVDGVLQDSIDIGVFNVHADKCPQCGPLVNSFLTEIVKAFSLNPLKLMQLFNSKKEN